MCYSYRPHKSKVVLLYKFKLQYILIYIYNMYKCVYKLTILLHFLSSKCDIGIFIYTCTYITYHIRSRLQFIFSRSGVNTGVQDDALAAPSEGNIIHR